MRGLFFRPCQGRKGHTAVTPVETKPATIGAMHQMIELHPKADALDVLGLPAIPYPVALPAFQAAVANDGELPLADMLRGLQRRAADPGADWQRLAPAMSRLSELIADGDARDTVELAGEGWWLEVAAIGAATPALNLLHDGVVLAAITGRADGRLRVCAYQPLDSAAIFVLRDLARDPADGQSSCWDRAHASAAVDAGNEGFVQGAHRLVHAHPGAEAPGEVRPAACVAADVLTCLGREDAAQDPDAA